MTDELLQMCPEQFIDLFSGYLGSPVTCEQQGYRLWQSVQVVQPESNTPIAITIPVI